MTLTFKVPRALALQLREFLDARRVTLAQFLREAVERELGAGPGGCPPAQAPTQQGTGPDASSSVAKSSPRRKPKIA